eukprot:626617-Pyramimonas_sp.AAC.1
MTPGQATRWNHRTIWCRPALLRRKCLSDVALPAAGPSRKLLSNWNSLGPLRPRMPLCRCSTGEPV